jgi:hypothetical protein
MESLPAKVTRGTPVFLSISSILRTHNGAGSEGQQVTYPEREGVDNALVTGYTFLR